jgi:hypothetical protein
MRKILYKFFFLLLQNLILDALFSLKNLTDDQHAGFGDFFSNSIIELAAPKPENFKNRNRKTREPLFVPKESSRHEIPRKLRV